MVGRINNYFSIGKASNNYHIGFGILKEVLDMAYTLAPFITAVFTFGTIIFYVLSCVERSVLVWFLIKIKNNL